MKVTTVASAAFLFHAILGGACAVPMAMAADVPAPSPEEAQHVMTPMGPVSPAHCAHCSQADEHPHTAPNGCDGQCMTGTHDAVSISSPVPSELLGIALPPQASCAGSTVTAAGVCPKPDAPPGDPPKIQMVVLVQ